MCRDRRLASPRIIESIMRSGPLLYLKPQNEQDWESKG